MAYNSSFVKIMLISLRLSYIKEKSKFSDKNSTLYEFLALIEPV